MPYRWTFDIGDGKARLRDEAGKLGSGVELSLKLQSTSSVVFTSLGARGFKAACLLWRGRSRRVVP